MATWNENSTKVEEFVDKFIDRILGASNDPSQRVPIYDRLENKFFVGKLLPAAASVVSEYKSKVAPCSYIATFLIQSWKMPLRIAVVPSFNIYFRTAIRKMPGHDREPEGHDLGIYANQSDPQLPATSCRDGMWIPWREQMRSVPKEYIDAVKALEASKEAPDRLHGAFEKNLAIDAYIRKRYCSEHEFILESSAESQQFILDLEEFREAYTSLGSSPKWEGKIDITAIPEGNDIRIKVVLTNDFQKKDSTSGDPNWYDVHLKIELLGGIEVKPVDCPVLNANGDKDFMVLAEAKNCAVDNCKSSSTELIFSPIARAQTSRRVAYEIDFTFQNTGDHPRELLESFSKSLRERGASENTLRECIQNINTIMGDSQAIDAIGMIGKVYSKAISPDGCWRLHQLAALIQAAASYVERERSGADPKPIVLNAPTAGGKTEAFFAAALFCAFYELKRKRRSINIIKYPMTLLSNDQVARLSKYSMVADEIAGKPLGIGYMVGRKGQYDNPSQVIERCPYPDALNKESGMCGAKWKVETAASGKGGVPRMECEKGHFLHLSVDTENMLTRECPAFIIAIWDKFVGQSAQRRLGLLFGAERYYCPEHGVLDFADTNQFYWKSNPLPQKIECKAAFPNSCNAPVTRIAPAIPGVLVFDEAHLIREASGTLDSHFETAYLQIAKDLSGRKPIPIVSTATIAGVEDFLGQLGIIDMPVKSIGSYQLIPDPADQKAFFRTLDGEMQHEAISLIPFDVVLTWAVPELIDAFFETMAVECGFDATNTSSPPLKGLEHLKQVMVYCSSYKNINSLIEMNRNTITGNRIRRGRNGLIELQLSSRYFERVKAQAAIERVRQTKQQIIYSTNIASIGIDIDNLDVIFFFGLPSNVSEFIQSMNRTGRRQAKPAICVAVLGPNKERDMSYYRYWQQFIHGANKIIEPIPLNRYASSAIAHSFNNIATALLLMDYGQRIKRKLFYAGDIRSSLDNGLVSSDDILKKLSLAYRAESDPAAAYSGAIAKLWEEYRSRLSQSQYNAFISNIFGKNWMLSLRSSGRNVRVIYPEQTDFIEKIGAYSLVTGDIDGESVSDTEPGENSDERSGQ
jgi:hypothetical protein